MPRRARTRPPSADSDDGIGPAPRGAAPGRPPAKIDPEQVAKLASLGHTMPEIAEWFGVAERTLRRRKNVTDAAIADAYRRGKAEFRGGLRSMQLQRAKLEAAGAGSGALLIWLGKCELGQRETVRLAGDPENPVALSFTDLVRRADAAE